MSNYHSNKYSIVTILYYLTSRSSYEFATNRGTLSDIMSILYKESEEKEDFYVLATL